MKRWLILIISSILISVSESVAQHIILHCETAGSLSDSLSQKGLTNLSEIHSLTVSGHLNAGDFRLFKQMALDSLDISEVKIDAFYGVGTYEPGLFGTNSPTQYAENEIPINAFSFRSRYNNSLSGMESLVYVVLPKTLKSIASEAFAKTHIELINLPMGLERICTDAFWGCSELKEITIPASVSSIGDINDRGTISGAFANCESLDMIKVADGNSNFVSIEGVLFSKDLTLLLQYPAGKNDAIYTIPEGTLRITHQAFEGSRFLEKVVLPASLEMIEGAFWRCNNLSEVVCEGEIPADWYAFGMTSMVEPFDYKLMEEGWLTVKVGYKSVYESDNNWRMFNNIREKEVSTGLENIVSSINIISGDKQINIHPGNNEIMEVYVYDIAGNIIQYIQRACSDLSISVPQNGIYIVNVNGIIYKCLCK
ncbi:MAG: leucine-rich repeat domain-containing protein [Parabacteroides sp.]|nr:leucine-rich repeat domain-containing protein [Parabacteroides sp.]